MLPLATAQIAHLCAKAYTGGVGVYTILPINPTYIIQNIALMHKTNKLLLYSHIIITKYLIIINIFFAI